MTLHHDDPLQRLIDGHHHVSEWLLALESAIGLLQAYEPADLRELQSWFSIHVRRHFLFEESRVFPALEAIDGQGRAGALVEELRREHLDILTRSGHIFADLARCVASGRDAERVRAVSERARVLVADVLAHAEREDAELLPLVQRHRQAIATWHRDTNQGDGVNQAPRWTVGDYAAAHPSAVPLLLRHGIDFCCGGQRDLEQAALEAGTTADALLAEVRRVEEAEGAEQVRWDEQPLPALVEHILASHHAPLHERLPVLPGLARKVAEVHHETPRLGSLAVVVDELVAELRHHLAKEEQVLFPWLLHGDPRTASAPVKVMMHEHEDAARHLARIRTLTDDLTAPERACASWRALYAELAWLDADLRVHVHLENNVLFPRALRGEVTP